MITIPVYRIITLEEDGETERRTAFFVLTPDEMKNKTYDGRAVKKLVRETVTTKELGKCRGMTTNCRVLYESNSGCSMHPLNNRYPVLRPAPMCGECLNYRKDTNPYILIPLTEGDE